MQELVSILIPAYNAEKWVAETITSALSQTWTKKEIIIVDDGSPDNTLKIAKAFESKTVKVVTQQNTGACGARNKALSLAQGSYIQWLDADDLLHPEKITKQLREAQDGASSRILLTCTWGKFFYCHQRASFAPDSLWQNLSAVDWIVHKFMDNVWMNPAVWLVSRRLTDLAGPWDERLSKSGDDDGEYICRVLCASEGVRYVPEAKCYYRIGNAASLDSGMGKSKESLEALLLSLRLTIGHLRSLEESDRARLACRKYLQTWLPYFYPDSRELLREVDKIAADLGGPLTVPFVNWKYSLSNKLVGPQMTNVIMSKLRWLKLISARNWDRMLYNTIYQDRDF